MEEKRSDGKAVVFTLLEADKQKAYLVFKEEVCVTIRFIFWCKKPYSVMLDCN